MVNKVFVKPRYEIGKTIICYFETDGIVHLTIQKIDLRGKYIIYNHTDITGRVFSVDENMTICESDDLNMDDKINIWLTAYYKKTGSVILNEPSQKILYDMLEEPKNENPVKP